MEDQPFELKSEFISSEFPSPHLGDTLTFNRNFVKGIIIIHNNQRLALTIDEIWQKFANHITRTIG